MKKPNKTGSQAVDDRDADRIPGNQQSSNPRSSNPRSSNPQSSNPQPGHQGRRERKRLPRELLRSVRRIELTTKRLVDRGLAGSYHSVFKGRGVEFTGVRPYQPGDDIRAIDWNVTARSDEVFVKQYSEERDLTIALFVDVSGSLGCGSRAILKRDLAAEIAAVLAFSAIRNQDRIGLALVSDRLERFVRPQHQPAQALRIVHDILAIEAHGRTDLDRSVPAALRNLKQRSVVFLISDFVDANANRAIKACAARHDLIAVETIDPLDLELPASGPVLLEDAETGERRVVSGRAASDEHRRQRAAERQQLSSLLSRVGADKLTLKTDEPYLPKLLSFFERRRKRLAR